MGHSYLGVEHLFLAIVRDLDAVPTQALAQVADVREVERHVLAVMNSDGYRTGSSGPPSPPVPPSHGSEGP
jgi:hypothetical protein